MSAVHNPVYTSKTSGELLEKIKMLSFHSQRRIQWAWGGPGIHILFQVILIHTQV